MKLKVILKKGAALLLSAVVAAGFVPETGGSKTVSAAGGVTEKIISGLGIDGFKAPKHPQGRTSWGGNYVYFGKYDLNRNGPEPVKYRVLEPKTGGYGGVTMLLDCDSVLWESKFDDTTSVWKDSYIRAYLNSEGEYGETGFLTASFDTAEQAAIAPSTTPPSEDTYDVPLEEDKVFLLRASDARSVRHGYGGSVNSDSTRIKYCPDGPASTWWLRTANDKLGVYAPEPGVQLMGATGTVWTNKPNEVRGVSPALNIDLSRVLFNTVVEGMAGTEGAEYKLTVLDDGLEVKVTDGQSVARTGGTITIPYTVAGSHAKEATQVSLLVTDKPYNKGSAQIIEYRALDRIDASGGEVSGSLEVGLTYSMKHGGKYFYIIAEDVNEQKETDYASEPVRIDIPGMESISGAEGGRTVSLDPSFLDPGEGGWSANGNKVYFGAYGGTPTAFRVLNEEDGRLLLDCDTILEEKMFFNDTEQEDEEAEQEDRYLWPGSGLKKWLNGEEYYGANGVFSEAEQSIIEQTPTKGSYYYYNPLDAADSYWYCRDVAAETHVFALSVGEADSLYADDAARVKSGGEELGKWWLRTQGAESETLVFAVNGGGGIKDAYSDYGAIGASPAMNIGESSILLVSASGSAKTSALSPVMDDSTTREWKLTLLDGSKTVEAAPGQQCIRKGDTVTVPYMYTGTGVNQISVMITDKEYTETDAKILYYGALQVEVAGSTPGRGTFDMPKELKEKTCGSDYFVYILAETVNGEKETDYASAPARIDIIEKDVTEIDEVTVILDEPEVGRPFDTTPECRTTGVGSVTVEWTDSEGHAAGQNAEYGRTYKARLRLVPEETYCFTEDAQIYLNQGADTAEDTALTEEGILYGTAVFTTAKTKLISITPPRPVAGAANGTPKDAKSLGLPETVVIVTEDSSVTAADVTWNLEELADGSYDPALEEEQTFTVTGMVTLPAEIENPGQVGLDVTIEVTVVAKGVAGAPMVSPGEGIYREDQSVKLTSGTEGAVIYYTIDGSEPEVLDGIVTNGIEYTGTVGISGTKGESVTVTVKAVAVKEGLQNSPTAVFVYTINLPAPDVPSYEITGGKDSGWTQGSDGSVTITGNGDFAKFTGVKVDGVLLDESNYEAKAGSTVITLKPAYLAGLSSGTHTFEILWTDGSANTTFAVAENMPDSGDTGNGDTGNGDTGNEDTGNGDTGNGNTGNGNSGGVNISSGNGGSGSNGSSGSSSTGRTAADGRTAAPMTGDSSPNPGMLFILVLVSGTVMLMDGKKWKENRR